LTKTYAILFDMYARFHKAYYGYGCYETLLTVITFLTNGSFVVIDCLRQNEFIKSATRCANRIWLQRECTREYYRLLSHFIRSCDWILSNVVRKIM